MGETEIGRPKNHQFRVAEMLTDTVLFALKIFKCLFPTGVSV